jgi:membrane-associated phospholipid phosphatase
VLNATWVIAAALTLRSGTPAPESTATSWTDDRPVAHMAQNLKQDVIALPRPETLEVLAVGLVGALATHPADDRVDGWARRSGSTSYTTSGAVIGDGWLQAGGAIATYTIGSLTQHPEATHVGSDLIRAQLLNGVLTTGIKVVADRSRPSGGPHSFPSGHTSASFASAAVLADHFGWKVGVPAYATAGFVGFTRLRDDKHWLSDVVFGASIGIIAGKTVTIGHRRAAFTVMPVATKNGAGLFLVKKH